MYCSSCGKQLGDDDSDLRYCPKCGKTVSRSIAQAPQREPRHQWEYKDVTVHLNISSRERDFDKLIEETILQALQREGRSGWQPEYVTDFDSLRLARRFRTVEKTKFSWVSWTESYSLYESVTIRLKRLVQD